MRERTTQFLPKLRLLLLLMLALGLSFSASPVTAQTCPVWACIDYYDLCPNTTHCRFQATYLGLCTEYGYTYHVYQASCGECMAPIQCSVGAW